MLIAWCIYGIRKIFAGLIAYNGGAYGQSTGSIYVDDTACTGTETSLLNCPHDSDTGDCTHSEDAGVRCHSRK